jgi:hypothetical protein
VGIGFLGIQYTNHGLAWDRLGHGITKVVSEAPAVVVVVLACDACGIGWFWVEWGITTKFVDFGESWVCVSKRGGVE